MLTHYLPLALPCFPHGNWAFRRDGIQILHHAPSGEVSNEAMDGSLEDVINTTREWERERNFQE
jgi:hypothetical protein